jgi:predicted DCC family thiol-disulfide oxidoreductase YuxK
MGAPVSGLDVVYDGLCLFCIRSLRALQRFDSGGVLVLHDANDRTAVLERFPALRTADLDDAMYVVDGEGCVHRGFFAFRRIVEALPALRVVVPLLHAPGVPALGTHVYAWVARNRRRLGCRVA